MAASTVLRLHEQGVFPVVIGGDHSIGYPDVRAMAGVRKQLDSVHHRRLVPVSDGKKV